MRIITPAAAAPGPHSRPLTGAEVLIVVVIMILATVLTVTGLPVFAIIELLGGTAAVILRLLRPAAGDAGAAIR
ncbi:hypothetical protein ACFWBI_39760 [Streptomyces sp. NPDC059982]|uniref:hypothetical protein n=1 Tax=unclassified Streptomyces TaxID=2593676 RepID=UPI00369ECB11